MRNIDDLDIRNGLPQRPVINAAFFAMALERGLDCAIMNPFSREMMQTYYAFCALRVSFDHRTPPEDCEALAAAIEEVCARDAVRGRGR